MTDIGSLQVRIGAQTDGLTKGLEDSKSKLGSFAKSAGSVVLGLGKLAAAAAAAGTALAVALTKQGLDAVDAQAKMARSLDATADGLRAMQIAADRAGVSQGALESAAQRLNASLAQAARTGSGPAVDALQRLGLTAAQLSAMDVDQRMATLADRMKEMGMSAGDAQDTLQQLGIRSKEMALLMTDGGDAIRQARQDVDDFGLSLSEVDARNVERANDALADVMRLVDVIRQRLAAALAPVIEAISGKFLDSAREAGGFRDAIDRAIRLGVTGFSHLANVVEVLRRAFVVATSAVVAWYSAIISQAANAARALIEGPLGGVNLIIRAINQIPGINVDEIAPPEISARLQDISEQASQSFEDAKARIVDAFSEPLPGEAIRNAYDEAVARANAASEAEIEAAKNRNSELVEIRQEQVQAEADAQEQIAERDTTELERRLERLRVSMLDEESLLIEKYATNLALLQEALDAELLTEEDHKERLRQLEESHAEDINRIRERAAAQQAAITQQSMSDQVSGVVSGLTQMIRAQDQGNKTMFEANKAFAIGEAIISAYQGISKTLSAYPWPVAGAMAAKHAAVAFGQVSSIRRQSFGGGGAPSFSAAGSSSGGMAAMAPSAASPAARATQTLQVSGISPDQLFSGQAVRELAGRLLDFQRDGGQVVFAN